MKSIITDKTLGEGEWALTLLARTGYGHSFLILEGMESGHEVRMQAHFAFKLLSSGRFDQTIGNVYYLPITAENILTKKKYSIGKTWMLSSDEKIRLNNKIIDEVKKGDVPYSYIGPTKISGSMGSCINAEAKAAAIRQKNGGNSLDHTTLALARQGENCIHWAKEIVRCVRPEEEFGGFAQYVAVVPIFEAGQRLEEQDSVLDSFSKCTIF